MTEGQPETDPARDAAFIHSSIDNVILYATDGEVLALRCLEEIRLAVAKFIIQSGR